MVDRRQVLMGAGALMASTALPAVAAAAASDAGEAAKLNAAFDATFQEFLKLSPTYCTYLGLDKGELAGQKAKLDHVTRADRDKSIHYLKDGIARIEAVDRAKLNGMDRVNYDTVLWDLKNSLQGQNTFKTMGTPYVVTQLSGAYQSTPDFLDTMHSIATKDDADAYLSRLAEYAEVLNEETANVKADAAMGVTPPDFALQKAIAQLKGQRDLKASDSVLVTSLARRAKEAGVAGNWEAEATRLFEGPVRAALDAQVKALEALLPTATHEAGVWRLPDGEAIYAYGVRNGTSTDMTADEIHNIGLEKVKEINAELDRVMKTMGLTQGTPGERMKAMAKDPKYVYPNTDAGKEKLLADLNAQIGVVFAQLPDYFGVLPKSKVDVRRVPKATELGAPGGYYFPPSLDGARPGAYYINLRDTAEVPSWTLPTLTYHEAIPGHHMQISIQQEAKGLPMLRQVAGFNAYVEGWALYAEEVAAKDMKMYAKDPAGYVGYLHDALFRACRLVVDTGMHHKRWSREKALTFMATQMGDEESSTATEIERYCVWPGQALGYMVGKIKWLDLRQKAQAKGGAKFDIKAFHDTGLTAGAMPLAVLEQLYRDKGMI